MPTISVRVEFGGGLELLFANQKSHRVKIPTHAPAQASSTTTDASTSEQTNGRPADITYLMYWLRDNLLKEREELFIENGTVYVCYAKYLVSLSSNAFPAGDRVSWSW